MAFEDDENMRDLLRRVTESMQSGMQATSGVGSTIRSNSAHDPSTNPGGLKPHTEFIGAPTNPDIETQPLPGGELTDRGDPAREISRRSLLLAPPSKTPPNLRAAALPDTPKPNLDYEPGFAGNTPTPNIVRPSEPLGKPEPGSPSEEDLLMSVHPESMHHGAKNRLKHGLENALLLSNPGENGWKYGLGQMVGNLAAGIISPKSVDKVYEDRVSKPRQEAEKAEADRETARQHALSRMGQDDELKKLQIDREKRAAQTEGWQMFPNTETGTYGLYHPGTGEIKSTPIKLPPPVAAQHKYQKDASGALLDVTDPNNITEVRPGKPVKPDKPPSGSEAKTIAEQQEEAGIDRAKLHADYAAGRKGRLADILGGADVFAQINNDLRSQDEQTRNTAASRMAHAQKQFDDEIDADIDKQVKQHVGKRTVDILGTRGQAQPLPVPQGTQTPSQGAVAPAHTPAQVRPDNTHAALIVSKMKREGKSDAEIQAELQRRGLKL